MGKRGFTLIELSVVIVIIGLIVAGIVAGQSLVEQAKFRSMISEINGYKSTINAFMLKYDAVPGDMDNATDYFSGVVNGDGNGRIAGTFLENRYAWTHIHGAELGPYYAGAGSGPVVGVGGLTPTTPFGGDTSFTLFVHSWYFTQAGIHNNLSYPTTEGYKKLFIRVSEYESLDANQYGGEFLSASDAFKLDTKYDDGVANTGKIITIRHWASGTCTTSSGTSHYLPENDVSTCQMIFHF